MKRAFKTIDTANHTKLHAAVIDNMIHTQEGLNIKYLGTFEEQFDMAREYINEGFEKLLEQSKYKKHFNQIAEYWSMVKQSVSIETILEYLDKVNELTRSSS